MMKKYLDQDPEEGLRGKLKLSNDGYTQREWERTVGWGKVPNEYRRVSPSDTDGKNTERSNTHREKDERTLEDGKEYALNDPIWDKRWT